MSVWIHPGPPPMQDGDVPAQEDVFMKWETPQAIELRFGMEITMYVANR